MKKQAATNKKQARQKLSSGLAGLAAFVVVGFLPMWGMYRWVSTIAVGDPRGLIKVEAAPVVTQTVSPFEEPLLTVAFDDGWESVYTNAYPLLEKYGIKTTQFIITDTFDQPSYMSVEQLRDMQAKGHEIGAHTVTHSDLTKLDTFDLEMELRESKKTLEGLFGYTPDFASPKSSYNDTVLASVKNVYRSHRNTNADIRTISSDDLNTKENFNLYDIASYSLRRSTKLSDLQAFIDGAKKNNAWIILTYHQVDDSEEYFGVSKTDLENHLKLIKDSGIKTVTLGEVVRKITEKK